MINFNNAQLCGCKHAPRVLVDNYAICACEHLVHVPSRGIGPMMPWDSYTATVNPAGRRELIARAKRHIGLVPVVDPVDVQDAVAAARSVNDNRFADDLEYEQWVASL